MQKINKQYCCNNFQNYYEIGRLYSNNILIKETFPRLSIFKANPKIGGSIKFRFVFELLKNNGFVPLIFISFCPFCGENLYNFYKSEAYLNSSYKDFEI